MLQLEIVSHCWNYARLLKYQLSSLVLHPPQNTQVTLTVFFTPEDRLTSKVLEQCAEYSVPRISWNWWSLDRPRLMRRAIGRHLASQRTEADWIWFADCDQVFGAGCLDLLAERLRDCPAPLVYPRTIQIQRTHALGDAAIARAEQLPFPLEIDPEEFTSHHYNRAIGGVQITAGAVARARGYCPERRYQSPSEHWKPTREDRVFRLRLGTRGEPIELPQLFRLRHSQRGQDQSGVIL